MTLQIVLKMISEFLVGGLNPSEKYEFVTWDYYSQHMGKMKNVPNHQLDSILLKNLTHQIMPAPKRLYKCAHRFGF